jgi:hypothetical protein
MGTFRTLAVALALIAAGACASHKTKVASQPALAGSVFKVSLVPSGQAPMDDTLIFTENSFESTVCSNAGFARVPYATRAEADGSLTWTASCDSETMGHNDWHGTVVGDHIEGAVERTPKSGGLAIRSTFSGDRVR